MEVYAGVPAQADALPSSALYSVHHDGDPPYWLAERAVGKRKRHRGALHPVSPTATAAPLVRTLPEPGRWRPPRSAGVEEGDLVDAGNLAGRHRQEMAGRRGLGKRIGACPNAKRPYASVIGCGNRALDKREKQLLAVADQVEVMVSESAVASSST